VVADARTPGPGTARGAASAAARVAVVVPAFQVADSIGGVLASFAPHADWLIVVDDGSSDGTAERVAALGIAQASVVRHPANRGVGAAMKTGFAVALDLGADLVVKVDGDGQMDAGALEHLLAPLLDGRADAAKGNRWYDRRSLRAMPRVRRYGNVALGFLTRLASGQWHVFDPNNGYVAWRADLLRMLDLDAVPDGYTFEAGMLVEIGAVGGLVADVPIPARYGNETSHLVVRRVFGDFLRFVLGATVRRLWRRYFVYDFTPVSLFLVGGLALVAFGTTFGLFHWVRSFLSGVPATAGTVILAALPFLLGSNLLLQALVLDIQSKPTEKLCRDLTPSGWRDRPEVLSDTPE
jgi:glycosyltransferase involved in cell wall biosynthesis